MRATTKALRALRKASKLGAPFTEPDHPLVPALHELERQGRVKSRKVGNHTYWLETELK